MTKQFIDMLELLEQEDKQQLLELFDYAFMGMNTEKEWRSESMQNYEHRKNNWASGKVKRCYTGKTIDESIAICNEEIDKNQKCIEALERNLEEYSYLYEKLKN